ncbi:MAG: S8 family serine peptidase [Polyangiaceae bacterium]|nr:S8 family serine peptidase [Polyangiaceae bacterium]
MRTPFYRIAVGVLAGLGWFRPAAAETSARALLDAQSAPRDFVTGAPSPVTTNPFVLRDGRLSVLVRGASSLDLEAAGLVEVAPRWAVAELTPAEVRAMSERSGLALTWSPTLRPLLDTVGAWISIEPARSSGDATGHGVVIGIIDTSIDPGHDDLRGADGSLRTLYYVDFSADGGTEPALEEEYCAASGGTCAIHARPALEALYANGITGDEPSDPLGHGTHVASLAAGSGLASLDGRYVGVAPESSLIAVRALRADGSIAETDVIRAVRFVFDQAAAAGLPAVVNLSLGTDFGAHDGTSPLELALADLVGPDHPGRVIVVAGGNGGMIYEDPDSRYPGPFGIHTEVRIPGDSAVRVPLLTPSLASTTSGSLYVWIGFEPGDQVAVGLDHRSGTWIAPVPRGRSETWLDDTLEVTIVNEPASRHDVEVGSNAAAFIVNGEWSTDTVFAIRLEGHGSARLWVQSAGALLTGGGLGGLFAGASERGTVNLPGTHRDLIAVGATTNRRSWPTLDGLSVSLEVLPGNVAEYSAAGPSAAGLIKPDLVAPGDFIIAAMAGAADPRLNGDRGLFAKAHDCGVEYCRVVDSFHGVASGTSMAAPIVAGAAALLLERDPVLDQRAILGLLQAGVTRLPDDALARRAGPGLLSVTRSLAALTTDDALEGEPSRSATNLVLADDFVRPGGDEALHGLLQLRTVSGDLADGARPPRISLVVVNGVVAEPLERRAPGSYSFAVRATPGTGGQDLTVRAELDDNELTHVTIPIAVDRHLATGVAAARGGCAVGSPPRRPTGVAAFLIGVAILATHIGRRRTLATRRSHLEQQSG